MRWAIIKSANFPNNFKNLGIKDFLVYNNTMELKVVYIGKDKLYWEKIKGILNRDYNSEFELEFMDMEFTEGNTPRKVFQTLYSYVPQIVYIDFSTESREALYLAKLMNRNNEMRLFSVVGLFDLLVKKEFLSRSILASVRINHIKSLEMHDVIFDPISLLDVDLAHTPPFVRSKELEALEISQLLRVGYVQDNFFHIETNSYLDVGEIIDLGGHPLESIMPSKKVVVSKFYDNDLYYNKRFAYDLEFLYVDDDYFVKSKERWKLYKELKEDPTKIEQVDRFEQHDVLDALERRKKKYSPIKKEIDCWLDDRKNQMIPAKLKVMVIDETLKIFSELDCYQDSFPYSLNIQTNVTDTFYQVKRTSPHLLVFNATEGKNTIEDFIKMYDDLVQNQTILPYFLVFNTNLSSEELQEKINYENVLCIKNELSLSDMEKLASALDNKKHLTNAESKVFIASTDPASIIWMKREVKVVRATESVLYLKSNVEIPMWTVFKVEGPVQMLLTVVPHRESGDFKSDEDCYRCLINGVGEKEKSEIRRLVNSSLAEDEEEEEDDSN